MLTTRRMTCFVFDGHLDAWSGWQQLPAADARRFGRLLRRRPSQVANAEVAGPELDRLLMTNDLPGCAPADDYAQTGIIVVTPGMPLTDFADACLDELEALHHARDRSLRPAEPGPHHTTLRVPVPGDTAVSLADAHYDIRPHHVTAPPQAPAILDAAPRPELRVPLAELLDVATALDTAHGAPAGQGYRAAAVSRFIRQARGASGAPVDALDLSAGTLNELIAYTGFGKSVVLVETLACWAARHGIIVTFVVPTNADVVRYAFQIEQSLAQLGSDATVTPLMSPRSVFTVAETSAHRMTPHGPDTGWIWSRLGYGCALAAAASTEAQVDAWQPGQEPCASLRPSGAARLKRDRVVACPWRMSCDKFALARAACSAGIIVTSHANLLLGRLQVPVDDGHGVTDGVTVEELVLRRSHMVVIDEIDSFQRTALDQAGRGLILDRAGGTDTLLRRFDAEFGAAFGRVHEDVDANVRNACLLTRFLSETYVSHLAYGRLGASTADRRRPRGPSRHWVVPRRWDAWLTARLLGLDPRLTRDRRAARHVPVPVRRRDPAGRRARRIPADQALPARGHHQRLRRQDHHRRPGRARPPPGGDCHARPGHRHQPDAAPGHPGADPHLPAPADGQQPAASRRRRRVHPGHRRRARPLRPVARHPHRPAGPPGLRLHRAPRRQRHRTHPAEHRSLRRRPARTHHQPRRHDGAGAGRNPPHRARPVRHRILPVRAPPPRPDRAALVGERRQPRHRHHRARTSRPRRPGSHQSLRPDRHRPQRRHPPARPPSVDPQALRRTAAAEPG